MYIMQLIHLKDIETKKEAITKNFENKSDLKQKNLIDENLKY